MSNDRVKSKGTIACLLVNTKRQASILIKSESQIIDETKKWGGSTLLFKRPRYSQPNEELWRARFKVMWMLSKF